MGACLAKDNLNSLQTCMSGLLANVRADLKPPGPNPLVITDPLSDITSEP